MTRGELRDKLARSLDESTTSSFWTTAELDQLLQEALETFCEIAEPLERHTYVPLRAGQVWYHLSRYADDIILPLRLVDPINERRLEALFLTQMDERKDQWETVTGNSLVWTSAGYDWFAIWPHAASDGGMLRLDYVAWPQDVLDDNVPLEVDEEDEDAILQLARAAAQAWEWQDTVVAGQAVATALITLRDATPKVVAGRGRAQRRLGFHSPRGRTLIGTGV